MKLLGVGIALLAESDWKSWGNTDIVSSPHKGRDFSPRVNFQCRLSGCQYSPCVQLHASMSVRMLKIPDTGSHITVWTHEYTTHTDRNGQLCSCGCCCWSKKEKRKEKTTHRYNRHNNQTKPAKWHLYSWSPWSWTTQLLTVIAHQLGSVLKVAVFLQKLDLVLLVRQAFYGCQHLLGFAVAVVQPGRLVAEAGDGEGRLWLVVDQRPGHRQALPLKLLQGAGKKQNNNGHSGMALLSSWTLTSCPQDRVASGQIMQSKFSYISSQYKLLNHKFV